MPLIVNHDCKEFAIKSPVTKSHIKVTAIYEQTLKMLHTSFMWVIQIVNISLRFSRNSEALAWRNVHGVGHEHI